MQCRCCRHDVTIPIFIAITITKRSTKQSSTKHQSDKMMFKYLPLASLAAVPTHGAGCYPAWSSGSDYFTGSLVSATITKTSTSTATDGTVPETTTSQTKNFKCTSGSQPSLSHCPNYDPSNAVQQAAAWSDLGECSGTAAALTTPAPTTKPSPSRWTNTGCPEVWTSGGSN